jgi:hypothetical protein
MLDGLWLPASGCDGLIHFLFRLEHRHLHTRVHHATALKSASCARARCTKHIHNMRLCFELRIKAKPNQTSKARTRGAKQA